MNRKKPERSSQTLSFLLGRAYYNYVVLLTSHLRESGLDEHLIPGMGGLLFVLFEEDNLPLKEVTKRAGIAPSTLTGMVRRMEASGLVTRSRDENDGRSSRLALTPLARSLRPRCAALSNRLEEELNQGLSADERETLRTLLGLVASNIQTALRTGRKNRGVCA